MVNRGNMLKWVEALESGEYTQGPGYLHNPADDTWCCLGVACDVAAKAGVNLGWETVTDNIERFGTAIYFLPLLVQEWLGMADPADGGAARNPSLSGRGATWWNDEAHLSFEGIAQLIRNEYLPGSE